MSCKYCTPQESVSGGAKGANGNAEDGCFIYCYSDGAIGFAIGYDSGHAQTSVPIEENGFKYCPYCGDEIKKEKFMQWINQKKLDNLLGAMRILADDGVGYEDILCKYKQLGGELKPWMGRLSKGRTNGKQ